MSRRGWALFAVMGVIWGLPYLLIKIADGGVSVPVLVFARVATGALLLLPVALRGGRLRALRPYLKVAGRPSQPSRSSCLAAVHSRTAPVQLAEQAADRGRAGHRAAWPGWPETASGCPPPGGPAWPCPWPG